jgi:hypothetical protein
MNNTTVNNQGARMLSYRSIAFHSALVAGLSLFSGNASALSIGVGPLIGANLGNASVEAGGEDVKTEMLTRMAFGARAEFGVTTPFSVLLEPMYLQRGATTKIDLGAFGTAKADSKLNYLELPVLAKAKFGAMKAHGYVFAGPSLGIFLNGEVESGGETEKIDSGVTTINFAGEVGVGGSYQVQEFIYLNADVRYSMGFNDANDESDTKWKSRDIRLMACVLFHLTK